MGAAGYFFIVIEQQTAARRAALRSFDLRAREATFALGEARAGLQAYVAAGQSSTYWVPKVTATLGEVANIVDLMRAAATASTARQALLDASASITELGNVDKRVRDYLAAEESLMASDVAFSEGHDAASRAALQVETARIEERQLFDADEARWHQLEAYALGAAFGWAALVLAILGFARPPKAVQRLPEAVAPAAQTDELFLRPGGDDTQPRPLDERASRPDPARSALLKGAAELCTELGRLGDVTELKSLLGRAARLLDASGLVVWLADVDGTELRAVMAHGYSDQVLALMRAVPFDADNAAAAAYRSGTLQVVAARPGVSLGALAAPMLAAEGCTGALTAEIRDGSEKSADVQSLALIFAAQLATVLTPLTASSPQTRTASA
jgi:hypothetical protein